MTHRYLFVSRFTSALHHRCDRGTTSGIQKDRLKEVLCNAIQEARQRFLLFAYVIMIDHLHLLTSKPASTSEVLRVLKGLTARRVIDYLSENNHSSSLAKLQHRERDRNYKYSLWQREKNVLPIFSEAMFMEKLNYIHQNPVRANLVTRAIDYRWSSAQDMAGMSI